MGNSARMIAVELGLMAAQPICAMTKKRLEGALRYALTVSRVFGFRTDTL
jgi:hypothetical protein